MLYFSFRFMSFSVKTFSLVVCFRSTGQVSIQVPPSRLFDLVSVSVVVTHFVSGFDLVQGIILIICRSFSWMVQVTTRGGFDSGATSHAIRSSFGCDSLRFGARSGSRHRILYWFWAIGRVNSYLFVPSHYSYDTYDSGLMGDVRHGFRTLCSWTRE